MNLWKDKEYKLALSTLDKGTVLLTDQIIDKYINLFWKDVMSSIEKNQHVLLLIRVKFEDNQIITLSNLQNINNSSSDNLSLFIKDRLQILSEAYKVNPISSIIFSYGIRDGEHTTTLNRTPQGKNINYQVYYRNEIPIAMVPEDYGMILSKTNNT